jgi:hypothetical protein
MNWLPKLSSTQQSVFESPRRFRFRSGCNGGKTRDMVCQIIAHAIVTPKAVVGCRYTSEEMHKLCERMGFECTREGDVITGVLQVTNADHRFPWSFTVSTFPKE